jgi:branched-chain amino acid transport system permease protein
MFAAWLAALPLLLPNDFYLDLATKISVNAMVCVGLNLLLGYAGQVSLGHASFFALGGYASAILCSRYGVPPALAMGLGALAVGLIAYAIGRAILRLEGHYLAMATLGFGAIVAIVLNRELAVTGGPDGMATPPFSIFGYRVTGTLGTYILAAAGLCVALRIASTLADSRVGRALRALRDSETAARAAGIDVARYKNTVFVVSAVFASFAGSIFAHADRFMTPAEAGFLRSVEFVAMVVVGGLGSLAGAVAGAAIFTVLPQLFSHFDDYRHFLTGALLVLIMVFMPAGVVPSLLSLRRARKTQLASPKKVACDPS